MAMRTAAVQSDDAEVNASGTLTITIEEASGVTREGQYVWPERGFPAFVKAELRGTVDSIKASTSVQRSDESSVQWRESFRLEVVPGIKELRMMLCKQRPSARNPNRPGKTVIAACGIYIKDIMDAVPIDKYFELFQPVNGQPGGYIRVKLDFVGQSSRPSANAAATGAVVPLATVRERGAVEPADVRVPPNAPSAVRLQLNNGEDSAEEADWSNRKTSSWKGLFKVVALLALTGAATAFIVQRRSKSKAAA